MVKFIHYVTTICGAHSSRRSIKGVIATFGVRLTPLLDAVLNNAVWKLHT